MNEDDGRREPILGKNWWVIPVVIGAIGILTVLKENGYDQSSPYLMLVIRSLL
jgi:hypothetical protein